MQKLISFGILIFLLSCNNKLPKDIIEQKKMKKVLWDILKVDAYSKNNLAKDSSKNVVLENAKMQQQIFTFYNINKEQFYKSYNYYLSNNELMKSLLDSVSNTATIDNYSRYSPKPILDSNAKQIEK